MRVPCDICHRPMTLKSPEQIFNCYTVDEYDVVIPTIEPKPIFVCSKCEPKHVLNSMEEAGDE